jgi:protein TonB
VISPILPVTEKKTMRNTLYSLMLLLAGVVAKSQEVDVPYNPNCGPRSEALKGQIVFLVADKMPQFPGGKEAIDQFINTHIKYSQAEKLQKPVIIGFVVDTLGQVVNACIMKSQTEKPTAFELEVLRVVQLLPEWTPGEQGPKKVPVRYAHVVKLK